MPPAADAATRVLRGPGLGVPRPLLAKLSDEHLANRLGRGDDVAFEFLYDRHHRGLLGFCRHMLRSHEEAEDAVQHVFLSAYRAITETGDRPARVKGWLYAIGRNRCLSIIRSRREPAQPLEEDSTGAGVAPPERAEERAELRELVADVRRLPDAQRTALVLAEVGDLSHADVAEALDCEPAKVKSLVFQARSALVEQRRARGVPCDEVREEIANMNGSRLKGRERRHVKACPGCNGYLDEIRRQRRLLGLALPVVPSLALRDSVLATPLGSGGGGAGGGGLAAGLALKTGATATAGGASAGGASTAGATGIVAALSAHTAVTKATAAALAAGSLAAGAHVAQTDRDPARQPAGPEPALGERQDRSSGTTPEASPPQGAETAEQASGAGGERLLAEPELGGANGERSSVAPSGRSEGTESEAPPSQARAGGYGGRAGDDQAPGHAGSSGPSEGPEGAPSGQAPSPAGRDTEQSGASTAPRQGGAGGPARRDAPRTGTPSRDGGRSGGRGPAGSARLTVKNPVANGGVDSANAAARRKLKEARPLP